MGTMPFPRPVADARSKNDQKMGEVYMAILLSCIKVRC
ncbi:hypothetical protein B4110_2216 [Parageobacillus toebii]|uniref:Uncharacterized protein n=1 Tax=Parageobacillus toebii TaxID=153151 RepID=A0A150N092_9BACL|nr:hypothetical protein B4110_2216 [Parageobacillus toebii]